jgi:hypothetical protein
MHTLSSVYTVCYVFPYHTVLILWTIIGTVIFTSLSPPSRTDYDSLLIPIVTHTSTPTSSTCGL